MMMSSLVQKSTSLFFLRLFLFGTIFVIPSGGFPVPLPLSGIDQIAVVEPHPSTRYRPSISWGRSASASRLFSASANSDIDSVDTSSQDESTEGYESSPQQPSFDDLGLCREAMSAIRSQPDWVLPTPIQQLVIPKLLVDDSESEHTRDVPSVWCEAPTGSGKTAAFALPLLHNLLEQTAKKARTNSGGKPKSSGRISTLILCPTRELAVQIGSVVSQLANNMSTKRMKRRGGHGPKSSSSSWNILTLHGGVPLEPQISYLADVARLGQTVDVMIATPGRLVDVLSFYAHDNGDSSASDAALERRIISAMGDSGSLSLEKIQELKLDRESDDGRTELVNLLDDLDYLVIDEADRLLGRAFETELDGVLDLLPTNKAIPTWLFSATFPKHMEPRIDAVWQRIMSKSDSGKNGEGNPILRLSCASSDRVQQSESGSSPSNKNVSEEISSTLSKKLQRTRSNVLASDDSSMVGPASTIQLRTIRLERPARTQALRHLLDEHKEDWDRVLVFVGTRYASEHVSKKLRRAGISSAELHGKLDQNARERRLSDLKRGKIRVLCATDVASRGLDIVGLPVMVNYDLPRSTADFVHRVGRTGRAGRSGTAISFVTPESEAHLDLIEMRHLVEPIEREVLPGFEPNEERWEIEAEAARISPTGTIHSELGLAHDRMFGGVKGRRKSKKDRLREQAAREQQQRSRSEVDSKPNSVAGSAVAMEDLQDAEQDWNSLTVEELKEVLRSEGLPVSGKKSELIERLDSR